MNPLKKAQRHRLLREEFAKLIPPDHMLRMDFRPNISDRFDFQATSIRRGRGWLIEPPNPELHQKNPHKSTKFKHYCKSILMRTHTQLEERANAESPQ